MLTKLKMAVVALCYSSLSFAQNVNDTITQQATGVDESAFTFTEAQLGENENTVQNITIINSGTNLYASQVGFQFSPMRFRYRGLGQKYNEVYVNGILMNDVENGQFFASGRPQSANQKCRLCFAFRSQRLCHAGLSRLEQLRFQTC